METTAGLCATEVFVVRGVFATVAVTIVAGEGDEEFLEGEGSGLETAGLGVLEDFSVRAISTGFALTVAGGEDEDFTVGEEAEELVEGARWDVEEEEDPLSS